MGMKGIICSVSCVFKVSSASYISEYQFIKGKIYPIAIVDRYNIIVKVEDKEVCVGTINTRALKKFFKPYCPSKRKSKYENWRLG